MSLRTQTAAMFAALTLNALGLLGSDLTGIKIHRAQPAAGPYMRKASAKKRNKFWAKNR